MTILLGEVTNGTSGTEDESEGRQIRDDWDQLINTIHENQIHTGLKDMAHQHDHYLYGTPKLED